MLKIMKECAPWLNWKTAGIVALAAAAIIVCTGLPTLGVLAGVAPVLLLVACLLPCLTPLMLLRRKKQKEGVISLVERRGQEMSTCGCGQDSCSTSCQSERKAETARV